MKRKGLKQGAMKTFATVNKVTWTCIIAQKLPRGEKLGKKEKEKSNAVKHLFF